MTAKPLPKVQTIKTRKGEVIFHFDPAKVPTRSASLAMKLQFAAAYIEAFTTGRFATISTLKLCVKWINEASEAVR